MIIVSGSLKLDASRREQYLAACRPIIEAACAASGCIDFHLTPDPLDPERINVFEQWKNAESVEQFRQSGPDADMAEAILAANVQQHEIASTISLT
jgi:quinol monooxygenase YgiN